MSLESRTESFDQMASRFLCRRPNPLLLVHDIEPEAFERLRIAAAIYMSKCLGKRRIILNEQELLAEFERQEKNIPNITPNGIIVPKRHTVLEFNALVRTFAEIIDDLKIQDLIVGWHVPLNLRIKFGLPNEENLKRDRASENVHSDSWAGSSSESVMTHVPTFGDPARNHVAFYGPPPHFTEEWIQPLPSYAAGKVIADQYAKINHEPRNGQVILSDFGLLHASTRLPGSRTRVSIDTTFVLKRPRPAGEKIHPLRVEERAAHEVLVHLGEKHLFYFPDEATQKVDTSGGFKHPSNLRMVELPAAENSNA